MHRKCRWLRGLDTTYTEQLFVGAQTNILVRDRRLRFRRWRADTLLLIHSAARSSSTSRARGAQDEYLHPSPRT
jgi:hypothetical protein